MTEKMNTSPMCIRLQYENISNASRLYLFIQA